MVGWTQKITRTDTRPWQRQERVFSDKLTKIEINGYNAYVIGLEDLIVAG